MRKHFYVLLVILLGLFASVFFAVTITKADSGGSWLTSILRFEKETDTQSLPSTIGDYGNIDCVKDAASCSESTLFGSAVNGQAHFNGTSGSYPILSYLENKERVIPIPNSNTAISYLTSPAFGLYFYFNHNFSSSLTKTTMPGTNKPAFQINRPSDGKLADKNNNRLAADIYSMSFSTNARWMIVSIPNVAIARVNLQTFEVLPFAAKFRYDIGLPPDAKTAITNDGRYAVVASKNQGRFTLYDLDTCAAAPNTINTSVSCQSRDLKAFMASKLPGFEWIAQARFLNTDLLSVYAIYSDNNVLKTTHALISNTDIDSQIDYLALGDSYISGEGAFEYQDGTDANTNKCHLSLVSYPYLIGQFLNYSSYHSVACSGAVMDDIINSNDDYKGQADGKEISREKRDKQEIDSVFSNFKPGYINQSDFVSRYRPKVINLSVFGNDIGFSKIVTKCAAFWNTDNCYESYEDRVELVRLINSKFLDLVDTFTRVKSQSSLDSRIYVIGYPQIAKPGGNCAVNVWLSDNEARFSELIIEYLNTVIKAAANRVGVYYVDTQDAFDGYRLCEGEPGSVAINGLTLGDDAPELLGGKLPKFIGNESYHPNELGHRLLKIKILAATNNLTNPMPEPDSNAGPPPEDNLEILDAPSQNRSVYITRYNERMSNDILFQNQASELNIQGLDFSLTPASNYKAELHSEPTSLGNFSSDSYANIDTQILIPDTVPTGFHTLHVYGKNLAGESIDIYKGVYVAANIDDYDGDGIDNEDEPCAFIEPSSQDYDQDGIDDACDGSISQPPPPAPTPPPAPSESQQEPAPEEVPADEEAATEPDESPSNQEAPAEDKRQTAVLGLSADDSGAQPPVSSSETSSQVDLFSPQNNERKVETLAPQSIAAKHSAATANATDWVTSAFSSFKRQWDLLVPLSLSAMAASSLVLKKFLLA